MFFFFPGLYMFAITKAEYEEGVPLREQQEKAYRKVSEELKKGVSEEAEVPWERVLVLWENLPNEKNEKQYLGHSEEWLLYMFGQAAASLTQAPLLYMNSLHTLYGAKTDDPAATVLRRVNILREAAGTLPQFLEDSFLDQIRPAEVMAPFTEAVAQAADLSEKDVTEAFPFLELAAYNHAGRLNRIFQKTFFSSLNAMLEQLEPPFHKDGTGRFVHQYFNWQSGKDNVKTCAARLDGVSAPSFYRYIADFEKSPLYPEYLKAYQHVLKDTPKQGGMPDCIEFMSEYNQLEGDENRTEKILEKFPEIVSVIDVPRVKAACDKKIALLKRKGLYRKTLREHGLESL